jgi:hypothetical protein
MDDNLLPRQNFGKKRSVAAEKKGGDGLPYVSGTEGGTQALSQKFSNEPPFTPKKPAAGGVESPFVPTLILFVTKERAF